MSLLGEASVDDVEEEAVGVVEAAVLEAESAGRQREQQLDLLRHVEAQRRVMLLEPGRHVGQVEEGLGLLADRTEEGGLDLDRAPHQLVDGRGLLGARRVVRPLVALEPERRAHQVEEVPDDAQPRRGLVRLLLDAEPEARELLLARDVCAGAGS